MYGGVLCYHPYLISMLFADLLSLHLVAEREANCGAGQCIFVCLCVTLRNALNTSFSLLVWQSQTLWLCQTTVLMSSLQ